ncbi:MAG TPA: hypothetical protein VF077_12320 [Nitrospiraceae bacterium]
MQTSTIPQPDQTGQPLTPALLAALQAMVLKAVERYPDEQARIARGAALAMQGHVELLPDGSAKVQSGSQEQVYYTVRRECVCADWRSKRSAHCKHLWGRTLLRRAYDYLHRPPVATADPQEPYAFPQYTTFEATYVGEGSCKGQNGQAHKTAEGFLFVPDDRPCDTLPCTYAEVALGPGIA